MKLNEVFLGKLVHWMIWVGVIVVLYFLGTMKLHVRNFVPFSLVMLGLSACCIFVIFMTYRKGERITREPFEES